MTLPSGPPCPAFNVVVYAEPGPTGDVIAQCAQAFVEAKTFYPLGGGLGYLTLLLLQIIPLPHLLSHWN